MRLRRSLSSLGSRAASLSLTPPWAKRQLKSLGSEFPDTWPQGWRRAFAHGIDLADERAIGAPSSAACRFRLGVSGSDSLGGSRFGRRPGETARRRKRGGATGQTAGGEAQWQARRGQASGRQGRGRGISGRPAGDPAPDAFQDRRHPGRGGSPPARISAGRSGQAGLAAGISDESEQVRAASYETLLRFSANEADLPLLFGSVGAASAAQRIERKIGADAGGAVGVDRARRRSEHARTARLAAR